MKASSENEQREIILVSQDDAETRVDQAIIIKEIDKMRISREVC